MRDDRKRILSSHAKQKKDLEKIWHKLLIVINPLTPIFNEDRRREIRNCKALGLSD